jgi:hypothetical protein
LAKFSNLKSKGYQIKKKFNDSNCFFLLLAPSLAKVEGMRKAGNLGKFLRTFTSGFSRLPAACSVRLAGKSGPAKMRSILMKRGYRPQHWPWFPIWSFLTGSGTSERIGSGSRFLSAVKTKNHCSGSGGSVCFWVSWILMRNLFVRYGSGPRSLHRQAKNEEKPGFLVYCFVSSL